MSTIHTSRLEDLIRKSITDKINERIEEITKEEMEDTIERVRKRLAHEVAGIAIDASSYVSMEHFGHDLRITVKGLGGEKDAK